MSTTTHSIAKYTMQVLNDRSGKSTHTRIIVRLYDEEDVARGSAIFEDYGDKEPPMPVGDQDSQSATCFMDLRFFQAFVDMLRLERKLYWKIAWSQVRPAAGVSHVSLDTKKEIIGEYFAMTAPG